MPFGGVGILKDGLKNEVNNSNQALIVTVTVIKVLKFKITATNFLYSKWFSQWKTINVVERLPLSPEATNS